MNIYINYLTLYLQMRNKMNKKVIIEKFSANNMSLYYPYLFLQSCQVPWILYMSQLNMIEL